MPRQVDPQQRRTEIAYAVWGVIAEHGLDGVTLRRVAAEAGISLGRVQHYFASKEALLQHACRTVIEVAAASFEDRTAEAAAVDAIRALVAQPVARDDRARAASAVWQAFLTRSITDPALATIIGEAVEGAQQQLTRLVARAQREGALRPALDPVALGCALLALGYGLAQQVLIAGTTPDQALAAIDATLAGLR